MRHRISVILTLATCAVLAGCRSFTAIGEWTANASEQVLTTLGAGCVPCESIIRRTLQRLEGDQLDAAIGGWAAACTEPLAGARCALVVDGKTVRRLAGDGQDARHLLAAIDHRTGVVLGQVDVAAKTNEISMFRSSWTVSTTFTAVVVTADALHAQRSHADYLVRERSAHYVLTVKGNHPALHYQLKTLLWKDVQPQHTSTFRAHGKVAKRIVKVVTVKTGIMFPHARQAIQITRKNRRLNGKKWTTEVVHAVTSLTAEQATAAELADRVRGNWSIENDCIGSATSPTTKTAPKSAPATAPAPWRP